MKRIHPTQIKRVTALAASLASQREKILAAITEVNVAIETYNETANELNGVIEDEGSVIDEFMDSKSDKWRDGDAGQLYQAWRDEWTARVDEMDAISYEFFDDPVEIVDALPSEPTT